MQIILIEDNQVMRDLLSINLKTYLGVDIVERDSAEDTINLLTILPNIDLIIAKNKDDKEISKLITYIYENNKELPILVLGKMPEGLDYANEVATAIDESNWEDALELATKLLNIDESVLKKRVDPNYIPIPVEYFLNIETTSSDVYIRIKKSPTEFQFVKRIHRGDTFAKDAIIRYIGQGLKNFYVTKEDKEVFTTYLSNELVKKLNNPDLILEEKIPLMSDTFDILSREIQDIGFNSSTIQLTESLVNNIIETNKDKRIISPLLRKILNAKSGYVFQHSHLTALIANEIAEVMKFKDPQINKKFTYAALFKDISLVDNEKLAQITTVQGLESADLKEEEWDLVFNHGLEGAILIRTCPEAPIDVDTIIKSHHGSSNGKGFVTKVQEDKFSIDAKVFIITVEFADELMRLKHEGGKPRPMIAELQKKYEGKECQTIIKALESLLKKRDI
jgi:HD-GYP domain-containing protein (c-di-GMP phosphodiesterase class II)